MKTLFLSIFLFICTISNAQEVKWGTEFLNIKTYNDSLQQFNEWEGWKECYVVIIADFPNAKIEIFSIYKQQYIIINITGQFDEETKSVLQIDGIDRFGSKCTLELLHFFDSEKDQIYIRWSNLEIVYQMKKL